MKAKIILITLLFIFLIDNVNAQLPRPKAPEKWYTNEYGVSDINDLTEFQLTVSLWNASEKRTMCIAFTILGAGAFAGGVAIGNNIDYGVPAEEYDKVIEQGLLCGILGAGGIIVSCIFIPRLIIYSVRISKIKGAANFEKNYRNLSLTPAIGFNRYINTYSSGLTITLNF